MPPIERALVSLRDRLPEAVLDALPRRYERLGHVLVLPRLDVRPDDERLVAQAYAEAVGARTVLVRAGTVVGRERRPRLRHAWGDVQTETVVMQHGVRFRFDAARVMFSAGNLEERRRMGMLPTDGETVVDLFAGLGYLSLPIAVHRRPHLVYGCEVNSVTCSYLEENVELNEVEERFVPLLGDCRDVAPRGVADRVIMGYLHGTHGYLDVAFRTLRAEGGVVHFHFKDGVERWPEEVFRRVEVEAAKAGRDVRLGAWRRVKPYAPRVVHGVLDLEVGPE